MSYYRKVLYLCEYCKHVPGDSTGYARLEMRNGMLNSFISIRKVGNTKWKAFLCKVMSGEYQLELLGELQELGENYTLTIDRKPCKIRIDDLRVILLDASQGESHYMAGENLAGCILQYEKSQADLKEKKPEKEIKAAQMENRVKEKPEENFTEKTVEARSGKDIDIEKSWAQKVMAQSLPMYPFEDDEISTCVKMDLKDLGYLPAGNWVLQKNTFLLQGYYAYRHILFAVKEDEGKQKYYLGIPGVFHRRDRFLANMFGFSLFKGVHNKKETLGDFGYWFKPIDE